MRAGLDDSALLHDDDLVGALDRREPVRDADGRAADHELLERGLHGTFGLGVERARGLVEYEDGRIPHDGACDGDALALAAGEHRAFFADGLVVAGWFFRDEIVRVRVLRGVQDFRARGTVAAECDVVEDGVVKEHGLLRDDGDLIPQIARVDVADVGAADGDFSLLRIVEAQEEVRDGRLSRAAAADERDERAGLHGEAEVVQHGLFAVAEFDVIEFHVRARGAQGLRLFRLEDVVLCVEQREDHGGNLARLLELVVQADERLHRLVEEEDAAGEFHDVARLHRAGLRPERDVEEERGDADGAEDFHEPARQFAGADDAHLVVRHEPRGVLEFVGRLFFQIVRLQDAVAAERLVDELALVADLLDEDARALPHAARVQRIRQQREGQDAHREQRELRMPEEQHGDEADDGDGLADDGDPRIAERVLDAVRGLKLRHERAGARAGEKAGAQREHMPEHPHAEIHHDAHRDPIHEIDVHVAEARAQDHR